MLTKEETQAGWATRGNPGAQQVRGGERMLVEVQEEHDGGNLRRGENAGLIREAAHAQHSLHLGGHEK
jgi:hypothetical protein